MDDVGMRKKLIKMSKECFVAHFWKFNDLSLSTGDIANYLMTLAKYSDDSCRTRASAGRRIVHSGRAKDALINISESSKVENSIREEARKILGQL